MNEENNQIEEPFNAEVEEWQAPPIPEKIPEEPKPEMSEISTLVNIFFEPSRVFKDLKIKPRFIIAALIMLIGFVSFNVMLVEKVGFENIVKAQMEASPQVQNMPAEDREKLIAQQSGPVFKYIGYAIGPIFILLMFVIGSLIYWLAINAFGGTAGFLQSLSVWIYSSFPPTVIFVLVNLILIFLKPTEDIDIIQAQRGGLLQANPSMLIDGKEMPVVAALLSSIDVLAIWGYILAVIGLKVIGKISTGSATAIVLLMALFGVTVKVLFALIF